MKTKNKNLVVGAVQCSKCYDIIISRHHYDCHFCTCGETMIDGGREYTRVGFHKTPPYNVQVEIIGISGQLSDNSYKHLGVIKTRFPAYNLLFRYTLNTKGKFYRYPKGIK